MHPINESSNLDRDVEAPRLPQEILLMIMREVAREHEYLKRSTLFSAALVNKEWSAAAIEILWQEPFVSILAALPEERRQLYADKVVDLFFNSPEEGRYHSLFKYLRFPRLQAIGIAPVDLKEGEKLCITQYMQPRLESFAYYGIHPCENALDYLRTECPQLQSLCLNRSLERDSPDAPKLIKFLQDCKSLKDIEFGYPWHGYLPTKAFAQLAAAENLERLVIKSFLKDEVFQGASLETPHTFANLQTLRLRLDSSAVQYMAAAAPSVKKLFLRIDSGDLPAFQALEPLTNLHHLEVRFSQNVILTPPELEALGKLQGLETLLIERWKDGAFVSITDAIRAPWLTDADFKNLMSKLGSLKSLVFRVGCRISLECIAALAKTHPQMYCCDMFKSFDLTAWENVPAPIFPNLRRLGMRTPYTQGATRTPTRASFAKVRQMTDILLRQAPMLEQLCFHNSSQNCLAEQILEEFAMRINGSFNRDLTTTFRSWEWMRRNPPNHTDRSGGHPADMELTRRTGLEHFLGLRQQ